MPQLPQPPTLCSSLIHHGSLQQRGTDNKQSWNGGSTGHAWAQLGKQALHTTRSSVRLSRIVPLLIPVRPKYGTLLLPPARISILKVCTPKGAACLPGEPPCPQTLPNSRPNSKCFPAESESVVPLLTSAASAPWRPSHAGAGNASHNAFAKTAEFGGAHQRRGKCTTAPGGFRITKH